MNDKPRGNRDPRLEGLAADLTGVAYTLALRHGATGPWIEMELDLWRALAETVRKWDRERPAESAGDLAAWQAREDLLLDLTDSAFHVAVKYGIPGTVLQMKLGLYRAFRLTLRPARRPADAPLDGK